MTAARIPGGLARSLAASAVLALAATAAHADTFVFSLANVYSGGDKGASDNSTLSFSLGAGALVTGFSWNVNVTAFAPSWLSELALAFGNSSGEGVDFTPVDAGNAPGSASASGQTNLVNTGLSFRLRPDGLLRLEFFDRYDDLVGAPDGRWNSGTLRFDYTPAVPEPATYALLALGLAAVVGAARLRTSPATRRRP